MLNVIQHGVTIAKLRDLKENCRHCTWKFDGIGKCVICYVEESSKVASSRLLVYPVFCQIPSIDKKGVRAKIKLYWWEQMGRTLYLMIQSVTGCVTASEPHDIMAARPNTPPK
jgi:hypothetical protein